MPNMNQGSKVMGWKTKTMKLNGALLNKVIFKPCYYYAYFNKTKSNNV